MKYGSCTIYRYRMEIYVYPFHRYHDHYYRDQPSIMIGKMSDDIPGDDECMDKRNNNRVWEQTILILGLIIYTGRKKIKEPTTRTTPQQGCQYIYIDIP